jgi:hypothetical protein
MDIFTLTLTNTYWHYGLTPQATLTMLWLTSQHIEGSSRLTSLTIVIDTAMENFATQNRYIDTSLHRLTLCQTMLSQIDTLPDWQFQVRIPLCRHWHSQTGHYRLRLHRLKLKQMTHCLLRYHRDWQFSQIGNLAQTKILTDWHPFSPDDTRQIDNCCSPASIDTLPDWHRLDTPRKYLTISQTLDTLAILTLQIDNSATNTLLSTYYLLPSTLDITDDTTDWHFVLTHSKHWHFTVADCQSWKQAIISWLTLIDITSQILIHLPDNSQIRYFKILTLSSIGYFTNWHTSWLDTVEILTDWHHLQTDIHFTAWYC